MELISYKLPAFEYKTPEPHIDENGELIISCADESPVKVPPVTFLFLVDLNDEGEIISAKGVDTANAYLLHLVINNSMKDVSLQSRALIQYFSFLLDKGLEWNQMPTRQSQRPTYRFKRYLEALYRSSEDGLKGSTSKGYMRSVVNFYRYYLQVGYQFPHPPFEHELIKVNISTNASSMMATKRVEVHTTDLRLKIPSPQPSDIPNRLLSLTDNEWNSLDNILRKDRRVIKNIDEYQTYVTTLPIEFSLIFLIMRYTGLRREEVISLKRELLFKPTNEQIKNGYINLTVGYFNGVRTKGGKDREIEIPAILMDKLHTYSRSDRYLKRLECYKKKHAGKWLPLFINNQGNEFLLGSLNARWSEIRKAMNRTIDPHHVKTVKCKYNLLFNLKIPCKSTIVDSYL